MEKDIKKNINKKYVISGIGIFGLLVIVMLGGCIEEKPGINQTEGKILIATTILPEKEFIEKVGKDKVEVLVMVPPGANPHTYEPTPKQMEMLSKAKIYAMVGSGIEFELGWMDKFKEINKNMMIINLSEGINLMKFEGSHKHKKSEDLHEHNHDHGHNHHHAGIDPHVWTSVKNAKIMVENIYNGLIKVDTKNENYYRKNKENYINELENLDAEISKIMEKTKSKKFIISHPAFGYFAKDYGLKQISIEYEGKEPSPKWIEKVIKEAKENNITLVFVSPQFNTKTAEIIAKEIDGKVVSVNPLAENYVENMKKFAENFE